MQIRNMRKILTNLSFVGILTFSLTACSFSSGTGIKEKDTETESVLSTEEKNSDEEIEITEPINYSSPIYSETSNMGIDPNSKNFMEQLVSGSFYVVHDGIYYPAFAYASNYDLSDSLKNYIDPYAHKQLYFTAENELEIPTIFLAKGDTLVYYDTENILDYVKWERYKDLGYTVGLYNIYQTEYSKLAYINLEEEEGCIISGSNLEAINTDMASTLVSLIRIGNVNITDELISNGLIVGAKANESYDLEVYDGTNYNHYIATADMHAFEAYELFASVETTPLQQFAWEIEIPEYFVNGYYKVNAICTGVEMYDGLIRIIKEDNFYNDRESFNEPLLFPYTEQQIADGEADELEPLYQYSDCDELNYFSTLVVGALGYDDGVEEKEISEKADILRTANINTFDINFPKGDICTISITPIKRESSGDAYVLIGNRIHTLTYNAIDNTYQTTITGDGNTYTLYISGFWNSYNIRLGNCKQDTSGKSQSIQTETLNDDSYSLDEYILDQNETTLDKGKEVLDSINLGGKIDTDASEVDEATEEISTEEEVE